MTFENAVTLSGAQAVQAVGVLDPGTPIDRIPEVGIGYAMRPALEALLTREEPGVSVRWEVLYTSIAQSVGLKADQRQVGGLRADLVVYDANGIPTDVIELKKYAESNTLAAIRADLSRVLLINDAIEIRSHVGVMVCETAAQSLDSRLERLGEHLNRRVSAGAPVGVGGEPPAWRWCFAVISRLT